MSYSRLILRDSADIVWPFDDLTESASISKSLQFLVENNNAYSASINPALTNVIFNPIVFGGGYSLSLTSSAIGFSIPAVDRFSELYNSRDSVISFWFKADKLFTQEYPIFKKRGYSNIGLFIKNNYLIFRYGTSSNYIEVVGDVVDINEPNHILISKNQQGIVMFVNAQTFNNSANSVPVLEKDNYHYDNNYLDFYGPPQGSWVVDSVAMYPNSLTANDAKRHYVYGLGKNIDDNVFYSRGGNLYNFYTSSTERLIDIDWRYPQEWKLTSITDLLHEVDGIQPLRYKDPTLYTYDNNISTASNSIKFTSSSVTKGSYIQIDKIEDKIDGGSKPFFIKVKFNGELPPPYLSQRVMSYGIFPQYEVLKFDLFNDNNQYQLRISSNETTASLSFNISNIESQPTIYVGMDFGANSTFYFAQSGSFVQSASFGYYSASGGGLDPMIPYFPPPKGSIIRIGSSLNYDETNFTDNIYGIEQFYGEFQRFFVGQTDIISSSTTFSDLDDYRKVRYDISYDSSLKRFKTKSYGFGEFNVHSINFAEFLTDTNQILGGNVVRIGYPDIESASQVMFYVTHLGYSGSVIYSKTKLNKINYLDFINNKNVDDSYLKFEFEIYSDDCIYYPPKIKYFNMETFKSISGNVVLKDDAGTAYTITQSSSSIFLPEANYTPSIFMSDISGLRINNSKTIFSERIAPKQLDPRTLPGLRLWLDSRFVNGLNNENPIDDSRVLSWQDLSVGNNAMQNNSASAPVFRVQSANLLLSNQLSGGDNDNISKILSVNCAIEASPEGTVTGNRGIKIISNSNVTDSYIEILNNTASITVAPNQKYNVFATIKLTKPQTGSALSPFSRGFIITSGSSYPGEITASAFYTNSVGTQTLSATFMTGSNDNWASMRLYNGSYLANDFVYWDNIGIYQHENSSSVSSWFIPLTEKDYSSVKFNGKSMNIISTASVSQPFTLYLVAKSLNNSAFISSSSSANFYVNSGSYVVNFGLEKYYGPSNNDINIFSLLVESGSATLYVNGLSKGTNEVGFNNMNNIKIGSGLINSIDSSLFGEIANITLYQNVHNTKTREFIENWLQEAFNIN